MRTRRSSANPGQAQGLTLIETSVVVLVLLSLTAILFVGARGWKSGTDRALCIMQIRQVQLAVRSYANTEDIEEGTDTGTLTPPVNLPSEVFGAGKFLHRVPLCPGDGLYILNGNHIPLRGALYINCTKALSADHVPSDFGTW